MTGGPSRTTDAIAAAKKALRHRRIIEIVGRRGFSSVEELAASLAVTTQTIRRDLTELSASGLLRRYHGGVGLSGEVDQANYRRRKEEQAEAKRRMGRCIAGMIPDGATVFLDTGTTLEAVAEALVARRGLRIVTYSLRVANYLSENSDFALSMPGGQVRNADGAVFGDGAAAFLRRFQLDVAVIGASGIDDQGMMSDDDFEEVALVRAAVARARTVILAADATKFGRTAAVNLGPIGDVATLVTDAEPGPALGAILAAAHVRVHVL